MAPKVHKSSLRDSTNTKMKKNIQYQSSHVILKSQCYKNTPFSAGQSNFTFYKFPIQIPFIPIRGEFSIQPAFGLLNKIKLSIFIICFCDRFQYTPIIRSDEWLNTEFGSKVLLKLYFSAHVLLSS